MPRFGKLDVAVSTTPVWMAAEDTVNPALGKKRSNNRYLIKSMENAGAKITFGSDFPVGGQYGIYPFSNIETGMTRKGFEKGSILLPLEEEKMTLESMIKGYTINAAYQLGMENEIGSLKVGKVADIIILSENLFKIKPNEIHNVKILETIMNGKTTYDINEQK